LVSLLLEIFSNDVDGTRTDDVPVVVRFDGRSGENTG